MSVDGGNRGVEPGGPAVTGPLRGAVEDYAARLHRDVGAKDDGLELTSLAGLSPRELSSLIRQELGAERDVFGQFSFAKHALELCLRQGMVREFSDRVARWLHACVEAGAFRECIRFAEAIIESDVWRAALPLRQRLPALFYLAKSLRNIGRYEEAKQRYREIIELAEEVGETVEISIGLLLIGKLYGNYLGQRSLFSCFIEEAKRQLENERLDGGATDFDRLRVKRAVAICHDALGQAYRDGGDPAIPPSKVQNHFIRAFKINREMGRRNGVSRALCHLNHFGFARAATPREKEKHLAGFKEGMDYLLLTPQDEKGMGVRFLQYSVMLAEMGEDGKAREYHAWARRFVEKYSDYKMQAQAAIVEHDLYKGSDTARAVASLQRGREVARRYNLIIQENEINRRLAETSHNYAPPPGADLPELVESTRLNLNKLIAEVKESFTHLNSADDLQPEFRHLSEETKRGVPQKLLLDYDQTVKQLDLNLQALVALLKRAPAAPGGG